MRKVLITGGTGSVGIKLVELFSSNKDYEVFFTYYKNQTRAKMLESKYNTTAILMNTGEEVQSDYDIIINNAAVLNSLASCEDIEYKAWEESLRVNVTIPFIIIKKNLTHMKKIGWGRIINISSIYGVTAEMDITPYNVTKHALLGLTKSVAKEYAPFGITCNAICPGTINSELSERLAKYYTNSPQEREDYFHTIKSTIPVGRLAEPQDVAEFAFFIAGEKAAYVNGATLMVDGGVTA